MKQGGTIGRPEDLTEDVLNNYLKHFLEIGDFKSIDNGRSLLEIIKNNGENGRVKTAIRKVVGLFCCDSPAARVCALQFLKEAVETGCFYVVQHMQKTILPHFVKIIEYRSSIDNIQRGSTFFLKEMDKNMGDEDLINIMKLSSTFFRMAHECLFVWGAIYFPGSLFDKTRLKMQRKITFPEFPRDFKFFSENKVITFKANCQALIKKMEERMTTESVGAVTRRSVSEDRNMPNSPRKIKETREVSKVKKAESKKSAKMIEQKAEQAKQQMLQDELPAPSKSKKQKSNKGSKQARKQFIQSKELQSQKTLENSSVKLRKKNSFNEVPFDLNSNSPKAQESHSDSSTSLKKQHINKPSIINNNTIAQNQESEGGRYSVQETVSKQSEEISEIMYDYNQRQSLSPRSQYSLVNKDAKGKLKKEISEQLPSNMANVSNQHKNNKRQQNTIVQKYPKKQAKPPTSKSKQKPVQAQTTPTKNQPKQSFNLPLNQLKQKSQEQMKGIEEVNPSQTERERQKKSKRSQVSARKKFVSSEEESVKEIKEQPRPSVPQPKNLLQSKLEQHDHEYISPIKEKKPQKVQVVSASKEEDNRAVPALPPRQKETNAAPQIAPAAPPKASKPMKLKSNTNLKTVFESSDYKIVEYPQPKRQQEKTSQSNRTNKQKSQSNKEQSKPREKVSIYEAVEMDTIQTIKQVPTVRQRNEVRFEPQNVQAVEKVKSNKSQNVEKQPQLLPMPRKASDKQVNQKSEKVNPPHQEKARSKATTLKQPSKQQIITIQQDQRQQPRHFKAIRNDAISSRRFRNFKEVNLFIQPKNLSPKASDPMNRTDELRVTIDESFQSTIKEQILEQFNRLKSTILEESMNRTQAIVKSEFNSERKESDQIKVECSTQTKLRHKSKGKFQRKGKYILLSDCQPQENTSELNLPKVVSSKPNFNANSRQTLQRKNSILLQKQQLKPNTLLYALYKRRSINP